MLKNLKRNPLRGLLMFGLLAALPFAAIACSGEDDDDDTTPTAAPTTAAGSPTPAASPTEEGMDYGDLSGNIDIDGSSTVYPITLIAAEEFGKVSKVRVNVGLSGTGGGFEKFCRGEIQISDASRAIKDSERNDLCGKAGITDIVELQLAIDALTLVVNPKNTWAQCLTTAEIASIFKADGVRNWKDVRAGFPDKPIILYYPGADSGTYTYFTEVLVSINKEIKHATDGTSSEDDNVLVLGVEGDEGAIGYFGLAYYVEAGKALHAVSVDAGKGAGCVEPNAENAQSGKYAPFSRPLFMYTREKFMEENPEILGFVNFYYENLDEYVDETGYAKMSDALKAEQYAKVEAFLP